MASRVSLHSQLTSIIETMAMSALNQVCKLVDEDSTELRVGLSQLLAANSALEEKVNSLECELTTVRSEAPVLCKSNRSVGVQTVCHKDGDAHVSGSPTIEGIFGKDWCMNLWKDRDPCGLVGDSPKCSDSVETQSNQITVTEIKEEDCVEEAASSCQQETLFKEEHEESTAEEPESVGKSAHGSTCSLSLHQDGEQVVCAGGMEEPLMQLTSINDTEEAFSTLNIPIEEEDDIPLPEEIQQELMKNTKGGRRNSENIPAVADELLNDFNMVSVETAGVQDKDIFTCQICNRTFFHKRTLTMHMKSHKSNFCNICKQNIPRKYKCKSHICIPPVQPNRDGKSCEFCGKTFATPSAVRIHNLVHTGEKPHRCSFCGKGFTQKCNLKSHLRIHTGDKPFRCITCGKTFTQKVLLSHHLKVNKDHQV
ncbi:Zinc finger protein Gfi-1 [Dissostichus eleginoides]|uniref:Zinc finger protein Gfi-1 n=1 Tax=Dissostichus eleginoides TaxID=100907 RepID=A0AAD9EUR9_DISEL|nr:Zinc finger protein Gfi-1 [Dissostichus eleginoides]